VTRKEGTAGSPTPQPSARRRLRKTKTERKAEVRNALARNEPTSSAPAEVDQLWANRINEADAKMQTTMADMVNAIITVGKTLLAAKGELGHGNFQAMVERKTRFKLRTAELYMQIAGNAFLANPQHIATLPPYVGTLGVLASWKPAALAAAVKKGHVTPELDRAKANELSREYGPLKAITARPASATPSATPLPPIPRPQPLGRMHSTPNPEPEPEPEPEDNDGFMVMPDRSGQVRMRSPEWRRELGPGVVVAEEHVHDADGYIREDLADPEVTDLATQLVILVERLRDLPRSKAQSVLKPLEAGLLELLDVLGYEFDQEEVT
jgi:hypothetical protein